MRSCCRLGPHMIVGICLCDHPPRRPAVAMRPTQSVESRVGRSGTVRLGDSVRIDEAVASDLGSVLAVERAAFGGDEEAGLVYDLLNDPSAKPLLSLLAREGDRAVGHILFTAARLDGADRHVSVAILAPLAVAPEYQRIGIGGSLIEEGIAHLASSGVELVFVLGHPHYYPRHGFVPAGRLGLSAPYPIEPEDAWMVRALRQGVIGDVRGMVMCAHAMDKPEYWRE